MGIWCILSYTLDFSPVITALRNGYGVYYRIPWTLALSLLCYCFYIDYCITGYDQCITGNDQCITGYDQCITGYDQCITSYDQCITGSDQCITGYDQCITGQ